MENLPEIPGYKIEKELGQGGMATVYLGIQEKLNRRVAIKVLSPLLLLDRNFISRFLKEAETAANLNHSGIVSIYDVGQEGNTNYIVMEYLEKRLRDLYAPRRPMVPQDALSVIRQVGLALGYAHQRGFIHRDIKPDNIMFRSDGTVVLTDFGIARAVDSATKLTKTGMSIGTPHYMSPEQARGQKLDGRSDLYALGILLFEMLTGSVPFDGDDSISIGIKHVQEPVPRLPGNLRAYQPVLDKLLAKNPQDRPQSGEELAELIDDLLGRDEPPRRPAVSRTPTPPWGVPPVRERKPRTAPQGPVQQPKNDPGESRHKQMVWVLGGLLSVLIVVLMLVLTKQPEKAKTPEYPSVDQSASSGASDSREETNAVDSEYARHFSLAKAAYENNKFDLALWELKSARDLKATEESFLLEKLIKSDMERAKQIAALAEQQRLARLEEQRRQSAEAARLREEAAGRQRQEEQARESSRYVSSASVNLRSSYRTVSSDEAKSMAMRLGIFMSDWNPSARGISHQYQTRTISGDWVVIDGATGLMWHQSGSDNYLNYAAAQAWLADLNRRGYAGYSDWRLPTLEEGASLLESSKKNGDLYIDPIFSNKQRYIWTGDSYSSAASWVVGFDYGSVNGAGRGSYSCVRPVRSGK